MNDVVVRKVEQRDNKSLAKLIRSVLDDFDANKPGFAAADPETDRMFESYQKSGTSYWVLERAGKLVGGAGIGKLKGYSDACELQKMYLSKDMRGVGGGKLLMETCLKFARQHYCCVYLETLNTMTVAQQLYRRYGFVYLAEPLGRTGHFGCDIYMAKYLNNDA